MASLTSSTAIYVGAAGLNAAVPFVVLPLLARWLGPAEFGLVGGYLAIVNFAAVLAGLSVHGIISVVHFRQSPSQVPAYVRGALRLVLLTGLALLATLGLLSTPLSRLTGIPAAWMWTAGLIAIGQFVVMLAMAVFQAREQPLRFGALQVGLATGWGALSLLLIGALSWDWRGRALGQLVAVAVVASLALWALARQGLLRSQEGPAPLATLVRFGLPLLPHSLAAAVMAGADRLLLTSLGGAESAGLYFAAFQMAAVITVGAAAINQAWVPWLYRRLAKPSHASGREVVRATYAIFAALMMLALVMALSAAWLVPLVAGDRYVPAVPLLKWLAPAAALSGMYYFVTNYFFYASRTGLLSTITVSVSALQLLLMFLWIPGHGAEGAAMAVLAGACVYWLSTWAVSHAVHPMPWFTRQGAQ